MMMTMMLVGNRKKSCVRSEKKRMSRPREQHDFSVVGDYKVKSSLGEGVNGAVKLGVHIHTGAKVALKFVNRISLSDGQEERIKREIRFLSLLHHPNIVKLYDCFEFKHYYVFAMERIRKGELLKFISDSGYISESKFRPMFRQILSAVSYCHQNSIVHRDLKPENILIDVGDKIKIIDFGLGNIFDGENLLDTFCGSPKYVAPEIIAGKKYTGPSVDIWSLGVILFASLSGKLPFQGRNMEATYEKILVANVNYPSYFSESVKDYLSKFFVIDPEKRITMEEAIKHPWILEGFGVPPETHMSLRPKTVPNPEQEVLDELLTYGHSIEEVKEALSNSENSPIKNTYFLIYEKNERSKQQTETKDTFFENLSNKINHSLKSKKNKFDKDGFLLDLTYITDNIIRMSSPSDRATADNPVKELNRFFEKFHGNSVKVYNLCPDTCEYNPEKLNVQVAKYNIHDYYMPCLELISEICLDISKFLSQSTKNVVAIHGKQDYMRPAVIICSYLIHSKVSKNPAEAISLFSERNWPEDEKKHAFTPSMRRYLDYYNAKIGDKKASFSDLRISRVRMNYIPDFDVHGGCDPIIKITTNTRKKIGKVIKTSPPRHYNSKKDPFFQISCDPDKPLAEDICVSVRDKDALTEEVMFEMFLNLKYHKIITGKDGAKKEKIKETKEEPDFVIIDPPEEEPIHSIVLKKDDLDIDKKVLDKFPDNFEFTIFFK